MRLPETLVPARIVKRLNRFLVEVEVHGRPIPVHLPNSGKVIELLVEGCAALLAPRDRPGRKTAFDLALVRLAGGWVCADARMPNALVREALSRGRIPELTPFCGLRAEAVFGASRFDFLLTGPPGLCLVEAKSVTLVEDGVAMFPDVPTTRGTRQLRDMVSARGQGFAGAVVFVVQREDPLALVPHERADPAFATALRQAAAAGVLVRAYRCRVSPGRLCLDAEIPVLLT